MAKSLPTGSAAQLTIPAFTLVEGLKELWLEEKFTDLTLLCQDGVQIQTHRVTLALLSPFFRRIFASLPSLEEDSVISVPDIGSDVLREVLKQVYLGSTEVAHLNPEIAFFDLGCRPYEPVKFSEQQHVADSKDWKDMVKAEITEYANTTLMFGDDEGGGGGAGFYEDYDDDEQPIFEGKKKTQVGKSKMWRYFQKLDKNTSRCNKCKADVKTQNGNTTGMRRHISRFHPEMADIVQKSEVTEEELNQGLKRSKVWTFFEVVDKESAKCRACDLIVKTQRGNTSGMARHLLRTHPALHSSLKSDDSKIKSEQENEGKDIFSDDFDNDDDNFKMPGPVDNQGTKKRSNIKKSLVWNYFVEDASGFEAKCKYCDIYVKTEAGNSSGLISHLRSGHPEQYEELNNLRGAPLRVSNTGARNSPVWQFFNDIGGDQVKCMKCGLILKYFYGTTSGLLRHLKRAHLQDFEAMKNSDKVPEENETIWKFFTENEKEEKAACNECMAEITNDHGTLALSCEEHLRANHTELLEQYESQRKAQVKELIKTDPTAVKRKYTSRVVASVIWTYFKKTETASVNQCLSCLVDIDCSQNSVAMVKHLEEVHPAEHEVFKKESGIGSKQIRKPSAIWKFFEVTPDPKRHKCLVSKQMTSKEQALIGDCFSGMPKRNPLLPNDKQHDQTFGTQPFVIVRRISSGKARPQLDRGHHAPDQQTKEEGHQGGGRWGQSRRSWRSDLSRLWQGVFLSSSHVVSL